MSHPSEQDLVMYRLGNAEDRELLEGHLQECDSCWESLREIEALLAATESLAVPEPAEGFEARVWERQREALQAAGRLRRADLGAVHGGEERVIRPAFWSLRRLVLAGALAASLLLAFLVGLYTPPPGTVAMDPDVLARERALLIAVGDHLQRTRMVLVELVNADVDMPLDVRVQRATANSLIGDSRLYRQTASRAGENAVAELLEELERILLEVARGPDELPARDLAWLRGRIESQDLLFKVSVIEGTARQAAATPRNAAGNL